MKRVLINPDGEKLVLTDDHDGVSTAKTIIEYEEKESMVNISKKSFDKKLEEYEEQGFTEFFRK